MDVPLLVQILKCPVIGTFTLYHSTILTGTLFIQLDFIFIILHISYNKFITFLSYFDHDRKYPNSRIVVDDSYEKQRLISGKTTRQVKI